MFGQIYGWLKAPDNTQTFSKINMSSLRFDCTAQKYAIVLENGQEGKIPFWRAVILLQDDWNNLKLILEIKLETFNYYFIFYFLYPLAVL